MYAHQKFSIPHSTLMIPQVLKQVKIFTGSLDILQVLKQAKIFTDSLDILAEANSYFNTLEFTWI